MGKLSSSTSGELHTWQRLASVTLLQLHLPHQHQRRRSHQNQNQKHQKLNEERQEKHLREEQRQEEIPNLLQNLDLKIQDLKITKKIQSQRPEMGQVILMVMICRKMVLLKKIPKWMKSHLIVVTAVKGSVI